MARFLALAFAALFSLATTAWAAESPSDSDNGIGNDPPKGSGNDPSGNANPGKSGPGNSWLDTAPVIVVAGDNVAPGSGSWGGGPGNSGPGDKNGNNAGSKDGGQTPNDDK